MKSCIKICLLLLALGVAFSGCGDDKGSKSSARESAKASERSDLSDSSAPLFSVDDTKNSDEMKSAKSTFGFNTGFGDDKSPRDTAMEIVEAFTSGDMEEFVESMFDYMYLPGMANMSEAELEKLEIDAIKHVRLGDADPFYRSMAQAMKQMKQVLSVEVLSEEIIGDRARVKIIEHNKNGTKQEQYLDFIKVNNKWKWKVQ